MNAVINSMKKAEMIFIRAFVAKSCIIECRRNLLILNKIDLKMRKLIIPGFIILFALTFNSCEEALNLLSDDPRDSFVGEWSVAEENNIKKSTNTDYYTVTIEKSANDSTKVFIKNFYAISPGTAVTATVSGDNINIASQTVSGYTIQGYGSLAFNGKTIGWSYTVDYHNNFIDQVTATYTKQ